VIKGIIFGLVFAGIGLGLTIWGYSMWSKGRAAKEWPSAEGTVASARVERSTSSSGSGSRRRRRTTYTPKLSYTYAVEGRPYTSTRIAFGGTRSYSSSSAAEGFVNRHPVGSKVTVYYNPGDPAESTLETGASGGAYVLLIIGVVFGLVGLATIVSAALGKSLPVRFGPTRTSIGPRF
jgi:hypothetical protein